MTSIKGRSLLLLVLFAFRAQAQELVINEFMANNDNTVQSDLGEYVDWVELHNSSAGSIDLSQYHLSDNRNNLYKWQLPALALGADDYFLVWADGRDSANHADFKLATAHEGLYVSLNGQIIDSVFYDVQMADTSMGRTDQGWVFFDQPTPGQGNGTGIPRANRVQFSINGGQFDGPVTVELSADQGDVIYYTLDGSVPDDNSFTYNGVISLAASAPVRAVAMRSGAMPSVVATQTYVMDEALELPMVMLSFNEDGFFSDESGIYVEGTNGIAGNCADEVNWNQDWERVVNFEYYENNEQKVNMQLGAAIMGGCSRNAAMKSLALKARSYLEGKNINYAFFKDKPHIDEFQSILLRNSGNDFGKTMMRDAFMQNLIRDNMDLELQAYQPVHVYFNGTYWGIHNLRERHSAEFVESNTGLDGDNLDLLEHNDENGPLDADVKEGDHSHYTDMIMWIRQNGVTSDANYAYIGTQMDIDNFIEYNVAQIYFGNTDWPGNNIRYYRSRSADGKWRWLLYDTDFGFGGSEGEDHNTLAFMFELGNYWPNPWWSTELFRAMMNNAEFKARFLDRMMGHMAATFSPAQVNPLVDSMEAYLDPEIWKHFDRWGGGWGWYQDVDRLRNYGAARPAYMAQFLAEEYGYGNEHLLTVTSDGHASAIYANDIAGPGSGFTTYLLEDLETRIAAEPLPGYQFDAWYTRQNINNIYVDQTSEWRYADNGVDYSADYMNANFDDADWSTGQAHFGYGDDDEQTLLDYGPDEDDKYPTYYFRKTFQVDNTQLDDELTLYMQVDDGAIAYLNGEEVARYNMPAGNVGYNDYASDFIGWAAENTWNEFIVNPALLQNGENILAIEIHQGNATSSDVSFDARLEGVQIGVAAVYSQDPLLRLEVRQALNIEARFVAATPITDVFINEVMAVNTKTTSDEEGEFGDWIELYNGGTVEMNVGGLFLTDELDNPTKYRLSAIYPDSTTIVPGGFLRLWMDDDGTDGPTHTGFNLDSKGEQLRLVQVVNGDTVIVDQMAFGAQTADISFGRYPDGADYWTLMAVPTPGTTNVNDVQSDVEQPASPTFQLFPNPANEAVVIMVNPSHVGDNATVVDALGRPVEQFRLSTVNYLNLESLSNGIYLVKIGESSQRLVISK